MEVDSQKLVEYAPARSGLKPVPRYPSSARDVSLLVPENMLAGDVIEAVDGLDDALIERVSVFDDYRGEGVPEGHKALAFSVVYRSLDRTLTDEEVGGLHERVVSHLVGSLGVQVRT